MQLVRHLRRLPMPPRRSTSTSSNTNSTTPSSLRVTSSHRDIEIPERVHRSSTDILYALSSTVGRDPTAPHYKYHDDPYLIPMSNVGKRSFAMAQEAGRKAAKWIKEQHGDLFLHQEAQPSIRAFAPEQVFTEKSEVDETTLQQMINQHEIADAVFVYNLLKQKGIALSAALQQSFLELLCFYNNKEPLPDELIEERWFQQSMSPRERQRKTWKDGELAEQIFADIEPKTAASYAALIRGMAKYHQAERAYALLQEATEKQFEIDTATFNAIIGIANFLKETPDQRWELCCDLLRQMAERQLRPDLGTINALLETVSTFGNYKLARGCALKVLAECNRLNINASLGTYYYVLIIFCRDRSPVSHVIVDILHQLNGKTFNLAHPKDTFFFVTAMDVCRNHLHDKVLARKVNTLLHTGNNYDLIGDSYKEAIYYRHYLALLCQTEPIEEFMRTYELLVPNVYIPEPGIMEEILKAVEVHGAAELVPRLWSDMVVFDHIGRESLLTRALQIMVSHRPDSLSPAHQQLSTQYANVALDIFQKVEESSRSEIGSSKGVGVRGLKLSFTGQMIGDILTLLVRGDGDFDRTTEVFNYIEKNQHRIPGTPSDACLLEYIGSCVTNRSPSQALLCLQYAVDNHMEGLALAKCIHASFTLDEVHLSRMRSLVGNEFLEA